MCENLPGERRDPRSLDPIPGIPGISDFQTTGGRGVVFLPQRFCTDGRVGEVFFFLFLFFFRTNEHLPYCLYTVAVGVHARMMAK